MNRIQQIQYLIQVLLKEMPAYQEQARAFPQDELSQRRLLRSLMNVRPPVPASAEFLAVQDAYLQERLAERGITRLGDLTPVRPGLYLWQGDITRLGTDGIVNAANKGLLGCFLPNHNCIDNAIHSAAGMQLRDDCAKIIAAQGHEENVGDCKLTRAYNLPCRYVLHTVGPMIRREVSEDQRSMLRSCYISCLDAAAAAGLGTVAFCCISTGVFNFPRAEAAEIAVGAVVRWKLRHPQSNVRVVFNTFLKEDTEIYRNILSMV